MVGGGGIGGRRAGRHRVVFFYRWVCTVLWRSSRGFTVTFDQLHLCEGHLGGVFCIWLFCPIALSSFPIYWNLPCDFYLDHNPFIFIVDGLCFLGSEDEREGIRGFRSTGGWFREHFLEKIGCRFRGRVGTDARCTLQGVERQTHDLEGTLGC
jgi:hypothetical protein